MVEWKQNRFVHLETSYDVPDKLRRLAQALSNRGRRGRKRDFPDAERLVKRLVAQELTLSFVPGAEQRLWRTVTRKKCQLRCDRIRL